MQDFLTIHVDDELFWFHYDGKFTRSQNLKYLVKLAVECLKEGTFQ